MPYTGFEPNPSGTAVRVTNHYTGRAASDEGRQRFLSLLVTLLCVWKNFQENSLQSSCRDWPLSPASSLVHPFDSILQEGQVTVELKKSAVDTTTMGHDLLVTSRNVPDKGNFVEPSPAEKMELASYVTKMDIFGDKGIVVCGGIM
ncbi:hypothetical protein TNCV_3552281 [Trichonephila clavipes]|nr:hypothetical protein TNCV_3552281 [Trichonephila clavipes]